MPPSFLGHSAGASDLSPLATPGRKSRWPRSLREGRRCTLRPTSTSTLSGSSMRTRKWCDWEIRTLRIEPLSAPPLPSPSSPPLTLSDGARRHGRSPVPAGEPGGALRQPARPRDPARPACLCKSPLVHWPSARARVSCTPRTGSARRLLTVRATRSQSLPLQTLQQPAMRLAQTLTANQTRLVGTLQQLHQDKSGDA